jgi:hypothetical protein
MEHGILSATGRIRCGEPLCGNRRLAWLRILIGRHDAGRPTAKVAVLLKIQIRGSISNCQDGIQSNSQARIMNTTRTALKRKRCPIAVIKSAVASTTVNAYILVSRLSRLCALVDC